MSVSISLLERSGSKCELCSDTSNLDTYVVSPKSGDSDEHCVVVCPTCTSQITEDELDSNHWRCLTEAIWSEVPSVKVVSHRLLTKLSQQDWASDLLNMMYLEDDQLEWAEAAETKVVHKDSNGHVLQAGDSVVLIKDLNVKGANFTAKRGTAVRRIRLVPDNANHIEGKVEGQQIVILTQYVKKS